LSNNEKKKLNTQQIEYINNGYDIGFNSTQIGGVIGGAPFVSGSSVILKTKAYPQKSGHQKQLLRHEWDY
jgi:hypothetical protein